MPVEYEVGCFGVAVDKLGDAPAIRSLSKRRLYRLIPVIGVTFLAFGGEVEVEVGLPRLWRIRFAQAMFHHSREGQG